jgi:uncharacterized protein with GYD domain
MMIGEAQSVGRPPGGLLTGVFLNSISWILVVPTRETLADWMRRRQDMATYVMTFNFTEQGIQKVKDSPARVKAAKETVESLGGEVKAFYAVLGAPYDTMFIVEAPDEESVAKMALSVSSRGNVRSATHRAFSEEEFAAVVSGMS